MTPQAPAPSWVDIYIDGIRKASSGPRSKGGQSLVRVSLDVGGRTECVLVVQVSPEIGDDNRLTGRQVLTVNDPRDGREIMYAAYGDGNHANAPQAAEGGSS